MAEPSVLDDFCGGTFWDINATWYAETPSFTRCFERTVLIWIPCGFLWVFAPLEVFYLKSSLDRLVPWTWLNIGKMIGSLILMVVQAADFFFAVSRGSSGGTVHGVEYAAPAILFLTILLQFTFVLLEKKRGFQSSGYLFLFWVLLVVCGIPEYVNYLTDIPSEDKLMFALYMVYFPAIVIMLILNCIGDAVPEHVHFNRGEKPSPEPSASFLNRIFFSWLDTLIWKGYRKPLQRKDLWNLTYENASYYVVSVWNKNYQKSRANAEKKVSSETWALPPQNANHIEMTGQTKPKAPPISILPTMVRTFGPSFLFGAVLKLMYDLLQFASPIILRYLIAFTESGNEDPVWHGYFYAVLMFVAAQVQSLILGQYFEKMFLIGLRIRTGVISAVYQKSLKVSSSARKESTVGEIVNLMSVDAQRFMDLSTYINLLWSAPLQIAIALYLLWDLLG